MDRALKTGTQTENTSMSRKYFGTDGIRGTANTAPMTAEVALKVGMAAGNYFTRGDHRHKVVIGKDTPVSYTHLTLPTTPYV